MVEAAIDLAKLYSKPALEFYDKKYSDFLIERYVNNSTSTVQFLNIESVNYLRLRAAAEYPNPEKKTYCTQKG